MEEIELLNYENEDFMGRIPRAIIRYGTGVLFLFTTVLLVGSMVFKYPNIVKASAVIHVDKTQWMRQPNLNVVLTISASDVWKIKMGQHVIIKLEKYPENQFGVLNGLIVNVSSVLSDKSVNNHYYLATVFLPHGILTSANKLILDSDLAGTAEIATNDESLFERIIKPIVNINHRNN